MYSEIASNKRKTWGLLFVFSILAVFLTMILGLSFGLRAEEAAIFGGIFATLYSLISFYLSDKAALVTAGAKAIEKRDHFELYNLVENLAITAGIPTPAIYIIQDASPNAFATGRDPHHASIAVTTGLLQLLNKQELQGVLAHEMSHIKNFDIRVMTIVVVLVGLIILLADILLRVGIHRGGGRRENNQAAILFFALGILAAILAPLVAQVIKFAVSRSREYLADASGCLLTRYPAGLASALEKIRDHGAALQHANHATAHLYISNPFGTQKGDVGFFNRLFATHPPINERIAKLRTMGE